MQLIKPQFQERATPQNHSYLKNSKKLLFQQNLVNGKNRGFVRNQSSLSEQFVGNEIRVGVIRKACNEYIY